MGQPETQQRVARDRNLFAFVPAEAAVPVAVSASAVMARLSPPAIPRMSAPDPAPPITFVAVLLPFLRTHSHSC
jgi:hypothetical protein